MNNLYLLRNWIFGITPSSVRKMIPGRYRLNMQSLQAIMHSANQKGIKTLIYIVPIRDDVTIPYDLHQYNKFKSEVELAAKNESARFINIEGLVPVKLWGSKDSTTIGVVKELDFMHFKAKGHELLAERLLSELELLWSEGK
jgi:lysophospholipase L1-like esterase